MFISLTNRISVMCRRPTECMPSAKQTTKIKVVRMNKKTNLYLLSEQETIIAKVTDTTWLCGSLTAIRLCCNAESFLNGTCLSPMWRSAIMRHRPLLNCDETCLFLLYIRLIYNPSLAKESRCFQLFYKVERRNSFRLDWLFNDSDNTLHVSFRIQHHISRTADFMWKH